MMAPMITPRIKPSSFWRSQPGADRFVVKDACSDDDKALGCVQNARLVHIMRTNIEIDDKLMSDALRLTGLKTKKEAVELGLRTLVRLRQQEELRRFRGKLQWEGDLNAMRTDK